MPAASRRNLAVLTCGGCRGIVSRATPALFAHLGGDEGYPTRRGTPARYVPIGHTARQTWWETVLRGSKGSSPPY